MTYSRPEVAVLGEACALIEFVGKRISGVDPLPPHNTDPAYDLDE